MNLEQDDQARQVVSLYAPLSTLSMQNGLYSLEWGPGAEYTNALSSLVMTKRFESGLNLMALMFLFVRSRWRIDLEIRDIRIISPSSFAATKLENNSKFDVHLILYLFLPDSIRG